MRQLIQFGAAAVLAAGVMAVAPGCQNSGTKDETNRSMNASATFDRAYVASRDTDFATAPGGTTHPLTRGTRVYFSEAPTSAEWQQARVEGQGMGYVRPADFTKEAR